MPRSRPRLVPLLALLGALAASWALPAQAEEGPARKREGGYLGLFLRETAAGVVIERLHPGSMAQRAGFEPGDVAVAVNGQALENGDAFLRWLWSGRELKVEVRRGEAVHTITTSTRDLDALPQRDDRAPLFTLPAKDGAGEVGLEALLRKGRPVVLVFGSFT